MVSTASMAGMVFTLVVSIFLPIALAIYFYKKEKVYIPAIIIGAAAFAVTQLMTRIPLLQWLNTQDWYLQLAGNTLFLALFLGLTAGLFEETGRFISFKYILKNKLEWKNGVAYGIGHGGFESIVIVGVSSINNLVFSSLINSGQVNNLPGNVDPSAIAYLTEQLTTGSPFYFMIGGLERIMVIVIHIALSLVVLYGVMNRRYIYWLYAVLLHAVINIPAVVLQPYGILWAEAVIFILFVIALTFIVKSRKWFANVTR